jgi:glycine cleavage system H lipoate-binding protein
MANDCLINTSPYGDGWIAQIKMTKATEEVAYLLSEEQYAKLIE